MWPRALSAGNTATPPAAVHVSRGPRVQQALNCTWRCKGQERSGPMQSWGCDAGRGSGQRRPRPVSEWARCHSSGAETCLRMWKSTHCVWCEDRQAGRPADQSGWARKATHIAVRCVVGLAPRDGQWEKRAVSFTVDKTTCFTAPVQGEARRHGGYLLTWGQQEYPGKHRTLALGGQPAGLA